MCFGLLVMFMWMIGDVCGVECGIDGWKVVELERMMSVYK